MSKNCPRICSSEPQVSIQHIFALSRVECTAVVQRSVAFVLLGISKIEILTHPGWGLLEEDRWVQLQDRFENLFQTKEDVRNRWLRTENWFNSTYWYRVGISQVTKETSFAARIHSHSVCFKFSVGRLLRNCWRITSLSREILFFEYSSLKLVSREIFFVEAFIIPNPALESSKFRVLCKAANWKQIYNITSHLLFWSATWI